MARCWPTRAATVRVTVPTLSSASTRTAVTKCAPLKWIAAIALEILMAMESSDLQTSWPFLRSIQILWRIAMRLAPHRTSQGSLGVDIDDLLLFLSVFGNDCN